MNICTCMYHDYVRTHTCRYCVGIRPDLEKNFKAAVSAQKSLIAFNVKCVKDISKITDVEGQTILKKAAALYTNIKEAN